MEIKNLHRKKQIKEFIDVDHRVMNDYYDIIEADLEEEELAGKMRELIKKDEYFFDPYLILIDLLLENGDKKEAEDLLELGFKRAVMKIVDCEGRWPKEMLWGFLENRHLMRMIERFGLHLWEKGENEEALKVFRKLLRSNPGDNQGIRDYILSIRLGLGALDWFKPFQSEGMPGSLDAGKLSDWFEKNAKKFPDEFDWLFEEWKKQELI